MLINVMYHHINSDLYSNQESMFDRHLEYISKNFVSTFPTDEKLDRNSICLIFDDAYADFYFFAYPLLKKYNLKALLAVPTKYILESSLKSKEQRLAFLHDDCFKNYEEATFCTFEELEMMKNTKLIKIVSHSHSHVNLLEKDVNLDEELKLSKKILEERLNIKVDTFVFPFGKYNREILKKTNEIYKYSFRIGSAVSKDFSGINGVNYRIKGDYLKSTSEIFSFQKMLTYRTKGFLKRISGD